ncbi:MAG TPA: diguanylate cyclase [Luteimonas sp.]|nr:diguanylate cyclase [Luteimonas sp.]HRP72451.1 diguanylate cyclase [Luteimonas sp.]
MSLRSVILPLLLATSGLLVAGPGLAQAPVDRQQQDIHQGEDCLRQMERDVAGAMALAGNMLAREDASDVVRVMGLACLMRGQLMTGDGAAAAATLQSLVPLLESTPLPQQERIKMQLYTATALQELGQLRQAGEVLEAALAESGPYTNLHLQALVAIALHHARGMGDPAAAEPYFERAIAAIDKRPGGPLPLDAIPYFNYGFAALEQGRIDDAAGLLEQARELARRDPHLDRLSARIEGALGRIAVERGDLALAHDQLETAVDMQRAMDDTAGLVASLRQLAELALLEGDPVQALEYGRESAELAERGQMVEQIPEAFELMARIHSALGNAAEARAWNERARRHLAEVNRERDAGAAARLDEHAPRTDAQIDLLGSLTRARVIGALALLALAATVLVGGWRLLHARRRQRQLVEQGATDPLTGLCNRRGATARIEALPPPSTPSAQDEDTRHALLLVDLDRFKAINDAHGHAAGDRVLAQVADRLRKACDDGDILARWGGEEFLVVRPDSSREAAFAFADHLRRAIEHETFDIDDARALAVTVSIGLAPSPFFPAADGRWTDAIDLADRALYVAKHAGRNAWVGIWGLAGGEHLDLHDLRENPEQALAQGLVAIGGNRPMSWSPLRDPRPAQGPAPDGDAGQDRQAGHGA